MKEDLNETIRWVPLKDGLPSDSDIYDSGGLFLISLRDYGIAYAEFTPSSYGVGGEFKVIAPSHKVGKDLRQVDGRFPISHWSKINKPSDVYKTFDCECGDSHFFSNKYPCKIMAQPTTKE